MARVFIIGTGPLLTPEAEQVGFPQLRLRHLLLALSASGHRLSLALLGPPSHHGVDRQLWLPEIGALQITLMDPEDSETPARLRALVDSEGADVVVSAGPYHPARLAAEAAGERPLWVDIPGDPFAEAQARLDHDPQGKHRVWMRRAVAEALLRGDAFGVISEAQRFALMGQLGWLGRLDSAHLERALSVVPVAYEMGALKERAPRGRSPEQELVVALCGGFNTWLDEASLSAALLGAMDRSPKLRVICTGGEIRGHHEEGFQRFRQRAEQSAHRARFTFHGWVPHRRLAELLEEAHLGICVSRPGAEPELGSRTRLMFYIHQGLEVMSTPDGDLGQELSALRLVHPLAPQDVSGWIEELERLAERPSDPQVTLRAQRHLRHHYSVRACFLPLLRWLESPKRMPVGSDPTQELLQELHRVQAELQAVHRSPTWRLGSRAARAWRTLKG